MPAAPRIFGIPASRAPVVAVLRRGPSEWFHVGRWDLAELRYEPGAWFRGTLYPQKCDLSPDGRWLAYSALKHGAEWAAGDIYEAISRLPWLEALAAWEAGTTYTRGIHFSDEPGDSGLGPPDVGDVGPCLARYGLRVTSPVQFAVERRRGWVESAATPSRDEGGPWDESREVEMEKSRPGGGAILYVAGSYAGFRTLPDVHAPASYRLSSGGDARALDGVQWADWDLAGRLLVATSAGALQVRSGQEVVFEHDLGAVHPEPGAAPGWAGSW